MKIYNYLNGLELKGTALALGLFDGLHLGHIKIIDELMLNKGRHDQSCVFTFSTDECRPYSKRTANILISNDRKNKILSSKGIECVICPPFEDISALSPLEFIQNILIRQLDAQLIVCGQDYRFGYKAQGNSSLLATTLKKYGRKLHIVPNVMWSNEKISSSQIRILIENGHLEIANGLLGQNFCIDSKILEFNSVKKLMIQEIPTGYVWPPEGIYQSIIVCDNLSYSAKTTILYKNQNAIAITHYEGTIVRTKDIGVELVRKL